MKRPPLSALLLGLASCGTSPSSTLPSSVPAAGMGQNGGTTGAGRGGTDGIDQGTASTGGGGSSGEPNSLGGVAGEQSAAGDHCPAPNTPATGPNIALHKAYAAGSSSFPTPEKAFDGDLSTTSGTNIEKDGALAVDLGAAKAIYRTVVHFSGTTPQRYKIQGSNDALAWTDILRVSNPNYVDDRLPASSSYRYLRLLDYVIAGLRGEEPNTLEPVNEIEVYEQGADDPPGCAPRDYPRPIDRKAWVATSNDGSAQGAVSSPQQGWIDPQGGHDGPDHWLTQRLQVGSYLAVDMGSAQTFNQLYTSADHDAVLEYAIYVSDDGTSWGDPITGGSVVSTGGHPFAPFSFPTQHKRHFKIESQYVADFPERQWGYWNVSALNVPEQAGGDVNIALGRPTTGSTAKNPAAVFDGDEATGTDDAGLIQIDLGMPTPIADIKVKFAMTNGGFSYDIETSDDGMVWTKRQTVLAVRNFRHLATNLISAHYTSRYLRFHFMPSQPRDVEVLQKVNEIEIYAATAP